MLRPILLLLAVLPAGCGTQSDSYLPLPGNTTLTYALTQVKSGDTRQQKLLTTYRGPVEVDGKRVYQQFTARGPQRLIQRTDQGILEIGIYRGTEPHFLDEPILLLPQPLEQGSTWQAPLTTHLLEWRKHSLENAGRGVDKTLLADFRCDSTTDTIETPAGTFTGVARITATGEKTIEYGNLQEQTVIRIEQTQWYAPGVGLVKTQRRESADSREINPGEASMVLERID